MPTVYIESDERYPDYFLVPEPKEEAEWTPPPIEVDEETLERWDRAVSDYERVQNEMKALVREAWLKKRKA